MKKLTIEQKAQKYDEALKVAKDIRNGEATYIPNGTPVIDAIFPELKESEDEKIRKEIISAVNIYCSEYYRGTKVRNDMLAWLEKQGEQKTVDEIAKEVCKNRASATAFLKSAGIMNEKGELAEQYRQDEQKPAEWSEKDETYSDHVITAIKLYYTDYKGKENPWREELLMWFKSLKDRVGCEANCTTTKEWSEEDRKRIQRISDFIWKNRKGDTDDIYQQEQDVKWLKSLKNRVISQLPKEWSEEDKRIIDSIISTLSLSKSNYESNAVRETNFKSIKWLKSLRPQKALEAE